MRLISTETTLKHSALLLGLCALASDGFAAPQLLDLSDEALTSIDYSDTEFSDLPAAIFGSNNNPLDSADSMVRESITNQFSYRFKTKSLGLWQDGEIVATASADYGVDTNSLRDWSKSIDLNRLAGIDTEGATRLNKLMYQHQFTKLKTNLTFGLQSFKDTFYKLDSTNLFAMSALRQGPELNLPSAKSFSNSAVGVKLKYKFDHYYVHAATYDSSSSYELDKLAFNVDQGLFTAVESGINSSGKFKLAAGAWNHNSGEDAQTYLSQDQQYGYYFIAETKYWDRASLFMQMGLSNTGLDQISDYRSAGAVIKDIFGDQDTLGVAFTKVAKDNDVVTTARTPSATAWEVTYRTPSLLTFDVQTSLFYQRNPSLDLDDAANRVMGLRFFRKLY